jgi:hypothetical protein
VLKRYEEGRMDIITGGNKRFIIHEEKQKILEMTSTYKRLNKTVASLENIIQRLMSWP